jgi:hypothetical protein
MWWKEQNTCGWVNIWQQRGRGMGFKSPTSAGGHFVNLPRKEMWARKSKEEPQKSPHNILRRHSRSVSELKPLQFDVNIFKIRITTFAQLVDDIHTPSRPAFRWDRTNNISISPLGLLLGENIDPRRHAPPLVLGFAFSRMFSHQQRRNQTKPRLMSRRSVFDGDKYFLEKKTFFFQI